MKRVIQKMLAAVAAAMGVMAVYSATPAVSFGFKDPTWSIPLQITTNGTSAGVYAPVTRISAGMNLTVGFCVTNSSASAATLPTVRFAVQDATGTNVLSWSTSVGTLSAGACKWFNAGSCNSVRTLPVGNYRLCARLGDADTAYFRFAVRNPSDTLASVFSGAWRDIAAKSGNDFAPPPFALGSRETGVSAGTVPTAQFGPFAPMNGIVEYKPGSDKAPLDIVFLVDLTGSMMDCLDGLKSSINTFFTALVNGDAENPPITDWRAKVVGYLDYFVDDPWFVDNAFTSDYSTLISQLYSCKLGYGGDGPESLLDAVWAVSKWSDFRPDATRVVLAFTDANYKGTGLYDDWYDRTGVSQEDISDHYYSAEYQSYLHEVATAAGEAARDNDVIVKVVAEYYYGSDTDSYGFGAMTDATGSDKSGYEYVSSFSSYFGDLDSIRDLAASVSASVKPADVVEPLLSAKITGPGILTYEWRNLTEAGTNNTFTFKVSGVSESVVTCPPSETWETRTYTLGEGTYTCQWFYKKIDYAGGLLDCGQVRKITWLRAGVPSAMEIVGPAAVNAGSSASYSAKVTFEDGTVTNVVAEADWSLVSGSDCAVIGAHTGVLDAGEATGTDRTVQIKVSLSLPGVDPVTAVKSVVVRAAPGVPAVTATDGSSASAVTVSWGAPSSGLSVSSYEVSRAVKGSSAWSTLGETTSLLWQDTTAAPGVDYTYRVRAANAAGYGAYGSDDGWRKVSLTLDPSSLAFGYAASEASVSVTAGASWSVQSVSGTVTASKSGASVLLVSVPQNTALSSRSGSVTVVAGASTDHPVTATVATRQAARPAVPVKLEITEGAVSLEGGESSDYKAVATFDDGSVRDVTTAATWTVSDGGEYGTIGAHTGRLTTYETEATDGALTVLATYVHSGYGAVTLTDSVEVSVGFTASLLRPVSLSVTGPASVVIGGEAAYRATVSYNNGTTADRTVAAGTSWTVSPGLPSASVAKASADAVLSAYAAGIGLVLTATYVESGVSVSGSKDVTVPPSVTIPVAVDVEEPDGTKVCALEFTTGVSGVANAWYGQTDETHDGVDAARSGRIFGAGECRLSTVVTNAGTVSFWWRVSSESAYDVLSFLVDGAVRANVSGVSNDWRRMTFEIDAGTHGLEWRYAKDEKGSSGADAAWVDGIVWEELAPPESPRVSAADGTSADHVDVSWTESASDRAVTGYEVSRAVKGSASWVALGETTSLLWRDTTAAPGVDYTYRVRAANAAGYGAYGSDGGWRAVALSVDPANLLFGNAPSGQTVSLTANVADRAAVPSDAWIAVAAEGSAAAVSVAENASLAARTGTVTVTAGAATDHPVVKAVAVVQSGRPPKLDIGFVHPYEDWRTRLQISTNTTPDGVYAPVSVFAAHEPLAVSFGWTNRSEIAVSVPDIRFRLYSPGSETFISEWTGKGRAGEKLTPGGGAWSGGWNCDVLKVLPPGDYRLEAELGPEGTFDDIDRSGDPDSDKADNLAIFRFAVRNPALDAVADVMGDAGLTNVQLKVGNDFAQAPHAAMRDVAGRGGCAAVQFGPYVPMNGVIGRAVTGKAPLDLVFLIDVTGSMWGCINGLKANIREFFNSLVTGDSEHAPITDWRAKVVGYRDVTCDYSWYEDHGFTTDVGAFNAQIAACYASAGGDGPESLLDAVWRIAKETDFREGSSRAIVAFTDAPYKTPMSYGGASGKGVAEAVAAAKAAGIDLQLVAAPYSGSDDLKNFAEAVSDKSTYTRVSSLSTTTLNGDMLRLLAKTVSAGVKEAEVVEPSLVADTRGRGTLSFDWKNDSTAGTNNTFLFVCDSVTNVLNASGSGWRHEELELPEGWHRFTWSYGKHDYDGAVSDCGILANVRWEPYATKLSIQPATLPAEYTGAVLPPYDVAVTNVDGSVTNYAVSVTNRTDILDGAGNVTNTVIAYGGKFRVDCNACWKVVDHDDWLKVIRGTGDGNGELIVEIAENTNYTSRTGFITVRAGEYGLPTDLILEKTVKVVQNPHPYVENGEIQILSVDVKPRWPWNQTVDIDFRVVTPEKEGTPVKVTFTGVNNEGGDMLEHYPALKAAMEVTPKSGNLTSAMGIVSGNNTYAVCPTSGLYRVSWNDLASAWYSTYPFSSVGNYAGWKQNGFHTPAFSVRLTAACDGVATVELPSADVRVDTRQTSLSATGYSGGAVMTGAEKIGHPEGLVDPVVYDSTDRSLFPSNGWNKLDFVGKLPEAYSNNYGRVCVLNDVYVEGGMIMTNTVWRADKVHVVRDNLFVHKDATLTVEDGTVVKFCYNTFMYIYKYSDKTEGSVEEFNLRLKGVYLTCGFDDGYGGNTLYYNEGGKTGDTGEKWSGLSALPILSNASSGTAFLPQIASSSARAGTRVSLQCKINGKWTTWKDRFYTRGQTWGNLPRPSEDGLMFYGWYCNDPVTWLTSDVLASRYPVSKAFMISPSGTPFSDQTFGTGTSMTKVTKNFRDGQIFALTCPEGWAESVWDPIDASAGHIALDPDTVVYDGTVRKPLIGSVSVNDSVLTNTAYSAVYGDGDYVSAGTYAIGIDFITSDYVNSPSAEFTIEPRPIAGGEILFSDPTNKVLYLPGLARPTVTVRLPDVGDSSIDDAVATRDSVVTWVESGDRTWPEVGDYTVVASFEDNPNYTGGAITNVFTVSVNPDYVFKEYATEDDVLAAAAAFEAKYGKTPRVLCFSGATNDVLSAYWKDLIRNDTALNDFVVENFVCWADGSAGTPGMGVRSVDDLLRDIVATGGVLTADEIFAFLEEALAADELPVDASGAVLTLAGGTSFTYDGAAHRPAVTVRLGTEVLPASVYDLVYSGDGVGVGAYSVYAVFGNGYGGESAPVFYSVVPKTLVPADVSLSPESAVYDGAVHRPVPVCAAAGLTVTADYGTGDYRAAGTYRVTLTATDGSHAGSVVRDFTVARRPVTEAVIELDTARVEIDPSKSAGPSLRPNVLSVRDAGRVYVDGIDYDLDFGTGDYLSAGVYTITATFKGNYTGEATVAFTIDEAVSAVPSVAGDDGATVTGDAESGFTVTPSAGLTAVEVVVPDGIPSSKVTVRVSPSVRTVKPNGAGVEIVRTVGGETCDITVYLDMPSADASGILDLTKATVKAEYAAEPLDTEKGAAIDLDADSPALLTAPTRKGLLYTLWEGRTLDGLVPGDDAIGDGSPWRPAITVKGGSSAFYTVRVEKGE